LRRLTGTNGRRASDLAGVGHPVVTNAERTVRVNPRIVVTPYTVVHLVIASTRFSGVTERAPVVMMMVSVAVMPVPVVRPAGVPTPPTRPVIPVPGAMPCVPGIAPKPVVYQRTIDINGFYYVVGTVNVLIAYYLNTHLLICIFLYVDRSYILVDIFGENGLQYDQALAAFARLHYAQIVHLTVTIQVEVAERAVWVVEHRLELFQVLSLRK